MEYHVCNDQSLQPEYVRFRTTRSRPDILVYNQRRVDSVALGQAYAQGGGFQPSGRRSTIGLSTAFSEGGSSRRTPISRSAP